MLAKTWQKRFYTQKYEFLSFFATLDDRGRILIPASVRKKMKLKFGSSVFVTIKPGRGEYDDFED